MKLEIITEANSLIYECSNKILLSDALASLDIKVSMPCGGTGKCGKCKIKAEGALSAMTKNEAAHLSQSEIDSGMRLACMTYAIGDACVYYTTDSKNVQVVSQGFMDDVAKSFLVENGYAAAIDIGTTTIAAYLYKFPENICINTVCELNNQIRFGSDVISRISYSMNGGTENIKNVIAQQIDSMLKKLGHEAEAVVITGNTTMLYLLTGTDVTELSAAPFNATHLFGMWDKKVFLCPCVSAYVGADLISSVVASGMTKEKKAFLVDIGTNGEMALWNDGRLLTCSTAAGPALEGAEISMGMTASDGAINKVFVVNGELKYTTIGNAEAKGICGTGLVDAISCMLNTGLIDETGYLEDDYIFENSNVKITAQDIRKVQLAKSAIRSGIDTLLKESGTDINELDSFYIAGGFGSYLDKKSCIKIGLIPEEAEDKIKVIGNGAGSGASMILKNKEIINKSIALAKSAEVTELSVNSYFMDRYVENMMF